MPDQKQPDELSTALRDIGRLLNEKNINGLIIGGLAASLLGRPRFTQDIDLMILDLDDRLPEFVDLLKNFDIHPRIENAVEFARESRVVLLRHSQSGINIDPNPDQAVVSLQKLTQYLLSETHAVGKAKAKFFRSQA